MSENEIKIPVELSNKLTQFEPRYVKVRKHEKGPFEGDWQKHPHKADDPELLTWLKEGGNYGVVGGRGLVILDLDSQELRDIAAKKLPETLIVLSPGHQGYHLYFRSNIEKSIRLEAGAPGDDKKNGGDLQADGKQVLGPGSIHPNGGIYKIIKDAPLGWLPNDLFMQVFGDYIVRTSSTKDLEKNSYTKRHGINLDITEVIDLYTDLSPEKGFTQHGDEYAGPHPIHGSDTGFNLNISLSQNVWYCFRHNTGGGPLELLAVLEKMAPCEKIKKGALRGDLFKKVLAKAQELGLVTASEIQQGEGTQADRLVQYVMENTILFHDTFNDGYVKSKNSAPAIYRTRDPSFKKWLAKTFYDHEKKAPNSNVLNSTINVIEGKACFDSPTYRLYNRVAPDPEGNGIWYDMGNAKNQAAHITKQRWEIVDDPPILFKRYKHQLPQVTPVRNGSVKDFLSFLPAGLKKNNDGKPIKEDEMGDLEFLKLVDLIIKFIPEIPHAINIVHGPKGSAKSTIMKFEQEIVDPSSSGALSLSHDRNEIIQQLDHHYFVFYDNVESLPNWIASELSKATTGGGSSKRELYTDDEDIIRNLKRCIGIAGINVVGTQSDLLDRTMLFEFPRMEPQDRREEQELYEDFEKKRPGILGAIFDVLVETLRIGNSIKVSNLPRMADYVKWACAAAQAIGEKPERFIESYHANILRQIDEVTKGSTLNVVLMSYLANKVEQPIFDNEGRVTDTIFEGTPANLLEALEAQADSDGVKIKKNDKTWPDNGTWLGRRLREVETDLANLGYGLSFDRIGAQRKRSIKIRKIVSLVSARVEPASNQVSHADTKENTVRDTVRVKPASDKGLGTADTMDTKIRYSTTKGMILEAIEAYLKDVKNEGSQSLAGHFNLTVKQLEHLVCHSNKIRFGPRGDTVIYAAQETTDPAPPLTHTCGTVIIGPPEDTKNDIVTVTCPGCHLDVQLRKAYPSGWRFLTAGKEGS